MRSGGKTSWKAIQVHYAGRGRGDLDAAERLAALYRLQNGESAADHGVAYFVEGRRETFVTDPGEIDWDSFPLVAALEAVTRDELGRLHRLFDLGKSSPPTSEL
jgi:hypothetical protein